VPSVQSVYGLSTDAVPTYRWPPRVPEMRMSVAALMQWKGGMLNVISADAAPEPQPARSTQAQIVADLGQDLVVEALGRRDW